MEQSATGGSYGTLYRSNPAKQSVEQRQGVTL